MQSRADLQFDESAVRQMCDADDSARAIIGFLSGLPDAAGEVTVDDVIGAAPIRELGLARTDVVGVMKNLAAFGAGRFITGRHGNRSRLAIDVTSQALRSAIDDNAAPHQTREATSTQRATSIEQHRFVVRPGLAIELPGDLTRAEAERLIAFIRLLPIDSAGDHE